MNFLVKNIVIRSYIQDTGYGAIKGQGAIDNVNNFFSNLPLYLDSSVDVDEFIIDMKHKDSEFIYSARDDALDAGMIGKNHTVSRKAKIKVGSEKYKAKVRLKGWYLDHLATEKLSFRINVKGGSVKGIRKLSLHAPFTKNFHSDVLVSSFLRKQGVLSPRSGFFNVMYNGKELGLMQYEEVLSEQITEYHSRPYGPLLRYDEKIGLMTAVDDSMFIRNSAVLADVMSNANTWFQNPIQQLYRFDLKIWADYLSSLLYLGCWHGNLDMNLAFYVHPITRKIEPISTDNSCNQTDPNRVLGVLPYETEFVGKLLSDSGFRGLVVSSLDRLLNHAESQEAVSQFERDEEVLRRLLISESPFLGEFKIDRDNAKDILDYLKDAKNWNVAKSENSDGIISPTKVADLGKPTFAAHTALPVLVISRLDDGKILPIYRNFDEHKFEYIKVVLEIEGVSREYQLMNKASRQVFEDELSLAFSETGGEVGLGLKYRLKDRDSAWRQLEQSGPIAFSYQQIHDSGGFFFHGEKPLNIAPGFLAGDGCVTIKTETTWVISSPTVLDNLSCLALDAGSEILIRGNGYLIVRGRLRISGSPNQPAKINIENEGGVLVISDGGVHRISGLEVAGGGGRVAQAVLRGATTFVGGDLRLEHSTFGNNLSEDALNLVQVKARLDDVRVEHSYSDGLDADFAEVSIVNSMFYDIGANTGGDAIDVSGSLLTVQNTEIYQTADKGVSVGEGSKAIVEFLSVDGALVGVAAKDSSKIEVANSEFRNIALASTMAYQKKEHFGGATIKIERSELGPAGPITQSGSLTTLDGDDLDSITIDIDALYGAEMRSVK